MSAIPAAGSPAASVELVAGGSVRDAGYSVLEVSVPAGVALPPHVCTRHDGVLVMLAGELEVVLADERRVLGPGGQMRLPRARPRRLAVLSAARLLCVTTPAGLEPVAQALVAPGADPDDLAALLAACGVTVLPAGWGSPVR